MSTQLPRRPGDRDDDPFPRGPEALARVREQRLAALVEAFMACIRSGGSLDPEPHLERNADLRDELEPLVLLVLHLESLARVIEQQVLSPDRGTRVDGAEGPRLGHQGGQD